MKEGRHDMHGRLDHSEIFMTKRLRHSLTKREFVAGWLTRWTVHPVANVHSRTPQGEGPFLGSSESALVQIPQCLPRLRVYSTH